MGDNSVVKISITPAIGNTLTAEPKIPILTVKDNKGNSITLDNSFIDVTCGHIKQDINFMESLKALKALKEITTIKLPSGGKLTPSSLAIEKDSATPPQLPVDETVLSSEVPSSAATIEAEAKPLNDLLKRIERVDIKVTLSEGVPSPLIAVCTNGKANNIIRDRH